MRSLGSLMFILGAGSLLLPLIDMQFILLSPLEPYQPVAGIVVAVIGAVLVAIGQQREAAAEAAQAREDAANPEPPSADTSRRAD
ncbi:MAG TPA: hypothetical protein VH723_05405 [Candidatus Limnocylindrales bacterium]